MQHSGLRNLSKRTDQRVNTIRVVDVSMTDDRISEHESESAKSATTESVSLDSDNELEPVPE